MEVINLPVFEILAILLFFFFLKWIPIIIILLIVVRVLKEVKEKAGEKVKGFENMMKGENDKNV